jgi:hypothetical protein
MGGTQPIDMALKLIHGAMKVDHMVDRMVDFQPKKWEIDSAMATEALDQIERQFAGLSPEAQLSLLERLVHRLRLTVSGPRDAWESGVSAMAADPEVQRELAGINAEFAATESDGLGSK